MPSASVLSRALACPASLVLPQGVQYVSDAAQRGTEIHAYLANQLDSTQAVLPLTASTEEYVARLSINEVMAGRTLYAAEVTYIYNPTTNFVAEWRQGTGAPNYRQSQEIIGGTADAILQEPDGTCVILDWKTGVSVEHPRDNKQLLFFAMCLHIQQPDIPAFAGEIAFVDAVSAKIQIARAEYTITQIEAFQRALKESISQAVVIEEQLLKGQAVLPALKTGAHCKYCPAFKLCPAQSHLASALAAGQFGRLVPTRGAVAFMTPTEAGAAWQRLRELRQLLAQAEIELRAYAEDTPIELPNGGSIRIITSEKESLDLEIAREVLMEKGGPALWAASVTEKISKAGIKRGLKTCGFKPKAMGDFLEIMADRGGVLVTQGQRLKQTAPTGAQLPDGGDDEET